MPGYQAKDDPLTDRGSGYPAAQRPDRNGGFFSNIDGRAGTLAIGR